MYTDYSSKINQNKQGSPVYTSVDKLLGCPTVVANEETWSLFAEAGYIVDFIYPKES